MSSLQILPRLKVRLTMIFTIMIMLFLLSDGSASAQKSETKKKSSVLLSEAPGSRPIKKGKIAEVSWNGNINELSEKNPVAVSSYMKKEREVLQKLFDATGGNGWKTNTGWIDETDEEHCGWYGVFCNDDGFVISLELFDNNLTGLIPTEIGKLSSLSDINISNNDNLSEQQLPKTEIGKLSCLSFIYLYNLPTEIGKWFGLSFFFMLGLLAFFLKCPWNILPKMPLFIRSVLTNKLGVIGEESVHGFFLTTNPLGWFIALFVLALQTISFALSVHIATLEIGVEQEQGRKFSHVFPLNSSTERTDTTSEVDAFAWFFFVVYAGSHTLATFVDGLKLLYMFDSSRQREELSFKNVRFFLGGFFVLSITSFGLYASIVFNMAQSRTIIELMTNTIVHFFVNDIDERIHQILSMLCPVWVKGISKEIKKAGYAISQRSSYRQD